MARRLLVRQHRSLDTDPATTPEVEDGAEEEVILRTQKLEL